MAQQATGKSYPLDNVTYDIVTILHEKSQALGAYDQYIRDAQSNPDVVRCLEEIRTHDQQDIEKLRFELGKLLGGQQLQQQPLSGAV